MNKNKIIWIACVIIVIVVAFFAYKSMFAKPVTTAAADSNAAAAATPSTQVQAQEVTVGTGTAAAPNSQVSVLYVGKLSDGTIFDSSEMHGNQPYTFVLGSSAQGSPIPGFQIGVNGMKEGGERVMSIPPSLGYGAQEVKDASGKVVIPANATIIFDVKLVKVAAAPAPTPAPTKK